MKLFGRQMLAVLMACALVALPVLGAGSSGLVGVAQGAGAIQINGQKFEGQASLFSGDRISTGAGSALMVTSSAGERLRFEPLTSAQVTRQDQTNVIHLGAGTVELATNGVTKTELPAGILVTPAAATRTLVQVHRLANGNAEVAVYKGSVNVADGAEEVAVNAGHTAVISPAANAQTDQSNKKKKKRLWAIFVATGVSAGVTAAIIALEPSTNASAVDP